MSQYLRFCSNCNLKDPEYKHKIRGRYSTYLKENDYTCEVCGGTVVDLNILSSDYNIIVDVSNNPMFIKSMIELHDTDNIEYTTKINQFKSQLHTHDDTAHCPKCNCIDIGVANRGYSLLWRGCWFW